MDSLDNKLFKGKNDAKRASKIRIAEDISTRYLNWLNSETADYPARMATTSVQRDHKFLESLRRVAEDIKFKNERTLINNDGSVVILWLDCSAKLKDNGRLKASRILTC